MNFLIVFSIFIFVSGTFLKKVSFKNNAHFCLFACVALLVRLIFAYSYFGHQTDVTDFSAWADMLFENGFSGFYASDAFTDYPPGYMYVLYAVGFLKKILGLSGSASALLVKLPPIAADICTAVVLKNYLRRQNLPDGAAVVLLFNPAVILNSSLWGQTDSILTLLIVLSIIALCESKSFRAYMFFAAAVLVKPQACMYAPLYIFFFFSGIKEKRTKAHLLSSLTAVAAFFALAIPFGIKNVLLQYVSTLSSYNYASVNAFNLWAALGLNWCEPNACISCVSFGFVFLTAIAALYLLKRSGEQNKYFGAAMLICLSVFTLSVKMHERYAYPAMIFALFFAGIDSRRHTLYHMLSAAHFFNTAYILFVYEKNPSAYYNTPVVVAASLINIAVFLYMTYAAETNYSEYTPKPKPVSRQKSAHFPEFSKRDFVCVSVITVVYAIVAFSRLGTTDFPENAYTLSSSSITLNFEKCEDIGSVRLVLGAYPLSEENSLIFTDGTCEASCANGDVFAGQCIPLEDFSGNSLTVSSSSGKTDILELRVTGKNGECITVSNEADFPELFDENMPEEYTYMSGTYFDEIYHVRTAYEFINKLPVYEWTHPPLGKIIISAGIRLFGMNPFGWRFAGALFGVLTLPVIFVFAKILFKKLWLCNVVTLLFAFDFMHYAQSRLGTIDVFVTFFIMLMYLFMLVYSETSFYDVPLKKTFVPLILCGASTGLAIACKWTGAYAAVGIAIVFFSTIVRRYCEYTADKTLKFHKNTILTLIFCVICFIIIPLGIYVLSYIPYLAANGEGFSGIWQNQLDIFTYHAKTVVSSEHPFASRWYTWPLMLRPIWYYSFAFEDGRAAGISAFGNPLVWWVGIAATVTCIFHAAKHKDKKAFFLLVAYGANFLPWALVKRTTFIYHYFPSVPFVVLIIGYSINVLYRKNHKTKYAAYAYTLCAILLFILFYPVLTGTKTNPALVEAFLRWLPGWVLI